MRLQLDSLNPSGIGLSGIGTNRADTAGPGAGTGVGAARALAADSAHVSGTSGLLHRLGTERADRVAHLAHLVQSGTYEVSGAALARSIVDQSLP